MTEIYYWEDDEEAQMIMEELSELGIEYEAILLDPEIPDARPSIHHEGKSYWDLGEFLRAFQRDA